MSTVFNTTNIELNHIQFTGENINRVNDWLEKQGLNHTAYKTSIDDLWEIKISDNEHWDLFVGNVLYTEEHYTGLRFRIYDIDTIPSRIKQQLHLVN